LWRKGLESLQVVNLKLTDLNADAAADDDNSNKTRTGNIETMIVSRLHVYYFNEKFITMKPPMLFHL